MIIWTHVFRLANKVTYRSHNRKCTYLNLKEYCPVYYLINLYFCYVIEKFMQLDLLVFFFLYGMYVPVKMKSILLHGKLYKI